MPEIKTEIPITHIAMSLASDVDVEEDLQEKIQLRRILLWRH